jgi:hypothetical protein
MIIPIGEPMQIAAIVKGFKRSMNASAKTESIEPPLLDLPSFQAQGDLARSCQLPTTAMASMTIIASFASLETSTQLREGGFSGKYRMNASLNVGTKFKSFT